jgi:N-acetylglucosamine kinase-like BadF-type ATPase
MYLIGIDGGGSTVRAAVTDETLTILGQARAGGVNPNIVGRDHAARTIQQVLKETLALAGMDAGEVTAVGAGIAGAMTAPFQEWLTKTLRDVLPTARIYITTDMEIALIGAHGERRGVLVSAGTGSAAFGVNDRGESLLVGGWGYLLGDEGSGAWIGLQALKQIVQASDRALPSMLAERVFDLLQIGEARELVSIIYQPNVPAAPRLARFAPLVLELADSDEAAQRIVTEAAAHLAELVDVLKHRLKMDNPAVRFGGGLLSGVNPLTSALQARLGLDAFPASVYPAEIGAALYAMGDQP